MTDFSGQINPLKVLWGEMRFLPRNATPRRSSFSLVILCHTARFYEVSFQLFSLGILSSFGLGIVPYIFLVLVIKIHLSDFVAALFLDEY